MIFLTLGSFLRESNFDSLQVVENKKSDPMKMVGCRHFSIIMLCIYSKYLISRKISTAGKLLNFYTVSSKHDNDDDAKQSQCENC